MLSNYCFTVDSTSIRRLELDSNLIEIVLGYFEVLAGKRDLLQRER